MVRNISYLIAIMALSSTLRAQQGTPLKPHEHDVYCAGMYTMSKPPADTFVVSGIESAIRVTFSMNDLVYINRGSKQGVQVGSEFLVMRPVDDKSAAQWFVWQKSLMRAMGTAYADLGKLRVVHADADTSTAQIVDSCDFMQRGDIVVPFAQRQIPTMKPMGKVDIFAPASGKAKAMIVSLKDFGQVGQVGKVVYVNLGADQGARVGNYYRIFRYLGDRHSAIYSVKGQATVVDGFGAAPGKWDWSNLPREILGEGIVMNVSQNSSTVLITDSLRDIYAGDYVELE